MKHKFVFDPESLSFHRVRRKGKHVFKNAGYIFLISLVLFVILFGTVKSPKEKYYDRQTADMLLKYDVANYRLKLISNELEEISNRDDKVYRVIFEQDPIPQSIRQAGFGGVNRYTNLENYKYSDFVISILNKSDATIKHLIIQKKSYEEIYKLALNKDKMLRSIPAIQPIPNKNLRKMPSGFGMRKHPIYRSWRMHAGMDFTTSVGTKVYATGDGVVQNIQYSNSGYGNEVIINHGYNYKTLYAHLSRILVKPGQKVKRGDVIANVGNTGLSTGPHLHYEVRKNSVPVNPINYYYNDLTSEEFDKMLEISSSRDPMD